MMFILWTVLAMMVVGGVATGFYYSKKNKEEQEKINFYNTRRYVLLHVLVPKNNEKAPAAAEQMFASLHGIFRPDEKWQNQISFEIISRKKFIHFYVNVPVDLKDFVEGQIYAQYPTVEISEVEDYTNETIENGCFAGAELILNKEDVYPIKTFVNFQVDPLAAITSVLAKTDNSEEIWVQIIVKPVSDSWQDRGISFVESIRTGSVHEAGNFWSQIVNIFMAFFNDVIKTAVGRTDESEGGGEVKLSGPQETALKGVEEKITKLGFATKIRVMCFSDNTQTVRSKLNIVAGVFKQFNTTNLNGFEIDKIQSDRAVYDQYRRRYFLDEGYVLNIEELASLYHLPNLTVETPNIVWAGSKKGEPPSNLPVESKEPSKELSVFAKTDFRHITQRFGIKNNDRRLHVYAIGKTGTGKSTMLENMIVNDIKNNKGVAVVDPHGELINHVLNFIPEERVKDVIYFNPSDREWPIGFNPLESVDPDLKNIVASGVVGIFKKIFGTSWGPRLEYILRNAILALLEYPDSTLLGVMKLLVDKDYRKKVIAHVTDPVVKDFFVNEYNQWDQKFRLEAIQSIQNKVGQFLSSSNIRNIVGQAKSSFDIREAMDQGKILLIDLSIGKIGEDNASLLGALLITKIQLAAMQRVDMLEQERRDFYLYVDEFQNFATDSFAVILSEARKYHLNLIMTHQYIAQMPETVAKAVFGNVGSIISFRVGSADAATLANEFAPVFEPNDLVNLDNYHIYIKMAIDGVTRPAFSALTLPPYSEKNNNRENVVEFSRKTYGKPRDLVEQRISEWSESREELPIETFQRIKKEKIDNIVSEEKPKANEFTKDGYIYSKFEDRNKNNWYIPIRKTENKILPAMLMPVTSTPILKPLLEKKKSANEIKKEIDYLISTHEIMDLTNSDEGETQL